MWGFACASVALNTFNAGYQAYMQASNEKLQYKMQASQHLYNARIAEINADRLKWDLVKQQREIESQAMIQGLQDAQQMAQTRVSHAGSGVRMNSASKFEVRASEEFMHKVSQANINEAKEEARLNAEMDVVNMQAQALASYGAADAANSAASTVNPALNSIFASLGAGASSIGSMAAIGAFDGAFGTKQLSKIKTVDTPHKLTTKLGFM